MSIVHLEPTSLVANTRLLGPTDDTISSETGNIVLSRLRGIDLERNDKKNDYFDIVRWSPKTQRKAEVENLNSRKEGHSNTGEDPIVSAEDT